MKFKIVLLTLVLSLAPVAFAQHGHGNGHQGSHSAPHSREHSIRERDGRALHRRIGSGDIRFRGGRREVLFGGFWFGCDVWPAWVFQDDVFFFVDDNGVWYVESYARPELRFEVIIVG